MPLLTSRQVSYLDNLFARAAAGEIPGTWIADGSLLLAALSDEISDLLVTTWSPPLNMSELGVVSVNQAQIDHGSIGGLTGDDHAQYHNNTRGDARYQKLTDLNNLSVIAAGTAYSLTNSAALLDFGTTDPSLTISAAGTYLIMGSARLDFVGATFAAVQTATIKLRRTNNTPADITDGASVASVPIVTTVTYPFGTFHTPHVLYTTANADDIIQLWGDVDVAPSAGSLDAVAASIVAVRVA